MPVLFFVFLVALVVVVFRSPLAADANSNRIQRTGDTTVVQATAPVHAAGGVLSEEIVIGRSSGPPQYSFGSVNGIAVGTDGSIFINDAKLPGVHQFNASGTHVRTLGGRGNGPGEYQQPSSIALLRDGRLLVRDPRNSRINVYSASGAPAATWNLVRSSNASANSLLVTSSNVVYVRSRVVWQENRDGSLVPSSYIRLQPDGAVVDTIAEPTLKYRPVIITNANGDDNIPLPFGPVSHWAFSPLGYFVTGVSAPRGNQYSFELRIPPGTSTSRIPLWRDADAVVSIRAPYAPVAVSARERADYRSNIETIFRQWDSRWRWPGPEIPASKAPYTKLWVDDDGRIWVFLSGTSVEDTSVAKDPTELWAEDRWVEPLTADVFEPSGRYIGRVRGKDGMRPAAARGDLVYSIESNADGFPVVKRYRIKWNP